MAEEGNVYAEEEQLVKSAIELLDADEAPVRQAISEMLQSEDLIADAEAIYMPPFYYAGDAAE